jgi:hypothetical protein
MRNHLDGRAGFALACAAPSLVVVASAPFGVFFGFVGATFAAASLIARDEPLTRRTLRVALLALVICVAAFAYGSSVFFTAPVSGD